MRALILGVLLVAVSVCYTLNEVYAESLDEKFSAIRSNTPKLITVLNNFPKGADLHNHVSGAAYIEYLLKFAAENDYFYDLENLRIVEKNDPKGEFITVTELFNREEDLIDFLDIVSRRGWYENTTNGADHFFSAFGRVEGDDWGYQVLARIIARNYEQGVRYIELMTGVFSSKLLKPLYELAPEKSFSMEDLAASYKKISPYLYGEAFANGVEAAMNKTEKEVEAILGQEYGLTITGETPDIVVRFIPQLKRLTKPYDIFITASAYLRASQIDKRIVAVNMVQEEARISSLVYFDDQMKILDFLWTALDEPKIALHAGELVLRDSPVRPMRDRISKSITQGHALRIGHGISIAWEKDVEGTLKMMREKGIPVEICLSSNDMILDISGNDHPLAMYLEAGVPVTIATDDEGILRSNLTREYVRAAQEHNLSYTVLKEIAKNGLKYSFLEGDDIYDKDGNIVEQYQVFLTGDLPTVSKVGHKAYLQIRHERDLAAFENEVLSLL